MEGVVASLVAVRPALRRCLVALILQRKAMSVLVVAVALAARQEEAG